MRGRHTRLCEWRSVRVGLQIVRRNVRDENGFVEFGADMGGVHTNSGADVASYYALRVARGTSADAWWDAAGARRDAPYAIAALLAGRTRVELSHEEAKHALAWAASVDGWEGSELKPVILWTGADAVAPRRDSGAGVRP